MAHSATQRHSIAPVAVLFAVGLAQAADLITFLRMIRDLGPYAEANPLVQLAATSAGAAPLIIAKIALVALTVAVFSILVRRRVYLGSMVATVALAAGLIGAFSNVATL